MQSGNTARPAPKPENWHGVAEGLNLANRHICDGAYQEAIDTLKGILEFAPSEPKAWSLLGDILEKHGHDEKATACHKKASLLTESHNIDHTSMPASARLAKLLWSQGDQDAARAMLALLLLRDPSNNALIELRDSWNAPSQSTSPGEQP